VPPAAKKSSSGHPQDSLVELAKKALLEITPVDTFVDSPSVVRSDAVATVAFPCALPGYPGWAWTIALNDTPEMDPSVLELELLPGEGALLPPDWVPWADRMEEYLIHEKELAAAGALAEAREAMDDDDDDEDDFDDDLDGVEIDQLDIELDPAPLEVPLEPNDVFDHVEFDESDPLDP
jgi:hypothetical protein